MDSFLDGTKRMRVTPINPFCSLNLVETLVNDLEKGPYRAPKQVNFLVSCCSRSLVTCEFIFRVFHSPSILSTIEKD